MLAKQEPKNQLTMRTALLLAATCTLISVQAQLFDLGPADPEGFELNGLNERPTQVLSGAQGGEDNTQGGISYDPVTEVLDVNIIWGAHTDNMRGGEMGTPLSSAFTVAHIHGPAGTEGSATPLYDLTTGFSPGDSEGGRTGFIGIPVQLVDDPMGSGFTVEDQIEQLFGGQWYINVHSVDFGGGEIRGQLIAVPEPEHYAAFAGLALLGFAGFRRYKNGKVAATA